MSRTTRKPMATVATQMAAATATAMAMATRWIFVGIAAKWKSII